jgi:Trans-aconitate methyltransferase
MSWSAKQYVAFEDERTRPARDLLAAIPAVDARSAIDIGCGPGNSTELLVERFANATVRGLDSSTDMIEAARKRLPQVKFDTADIDTWNENGPFDVIFANAVLQWLPDHAKLLPALASKLTPGGSLAIQMPDNLNEPSHRLMREVAADGPMGWQTGGRRRAADGNGRCQWLLLDAASPLFPCRCVAHDLPSSTGWRRIWCGRVVQGQRIAAVS